MHASRIGFLGTVVLFAAIAACSDDVTDPASLNSFNALLNGAVVRPTAINTPATGSATFSHSGGNVTYNVSYSGLKGILTAAHIHIGTPTASGGVVLNLCSAGAAPACPASSRTGSFSGTANQTYVAGGLTMDSVLTLMRQRNAYINLHTDTAGGGTPSGEIRGNIVAQ